MWAYDKKSNNSWISTSKNSNEFGICTSGSLNYQVCNNTIPSNVNAIYIFTGLLDSKESLNAALNPYGESSCATSAYDIAANFFTLNKKNKNIGIVMGGGGTTWNDNACKNIIDSIPTIATYFKSIVFDLEIYSGLSVNVFNSLLTASKNAGLQTIITISHSAPFSVDDRYKTWADILNSGIADYISPQLYTQDFGTANEYSEGQFPWTTFKSYVSINKVLPSLFTNSSPYYDLFNTGGSNDGLSPMIYENDSMTSCLVTYYPDTSSFSVKNFTVDKGANNFFQILYNTNMSCAGSIQFTNGIITPPQPSQPQPSPTPQPQPQPSPTPQPQPSPTPQPQPQPSPTPQPQPQPQPLPTPQPQPLPTPQPQPSPQPNVIDTENECECECEYLNNTNYDESECESIPELVPSSITNNTNNTWNEAGVECWNGETIYGSPNDNSIYTNNYYNEYIPSEDCSSQFPWRGGEIIGFYFWTYNKDNTIENIKIATDGKNSLVKNTKVLIGGPKNPYYNVIPNGTNSVFLFSGYSTFTELIQHNKQNSSVYEGSKQYFKSNGFSNMKGSTKPYLIGITIGGGDTHWSTSKIDSLILEFKNNAILYGDCDNIFEEKNINDSNRYPSIHYNAIMFDIENIDYSVNNTNLSQDLVKSFNNFFKIIKQNNTNWVIGVTIPHNSPFIYDNSFIDGIIKSPYLDYISPQLYTTDYGLLNEYSRTVSSKSYWSDFYNSVVSSPKYKKYNTNIILPSLLFINSPFMFSNKKYLGLYNDAGSNSNNIPYIEVENSLVPDGVNLFPNINNKNFHKTYPIQNDKGAFDFFTKMFYPSNSLGGAIGFSNNFPY